MVEYVARIVEVSIPYKILVVKLEGKRTLEKPRRRWEDNVNMDLSGTGLETVDWNNLAQDGNSWHTLLSSVINLPGF